MRKADVPAARAIKKGRFSSTSFWKDVQAIDDELVRASERGASTPDGVPFAYHPLPRNANRCARCAKYKLACFVSDHALSGRGTYKCQPCFAQKIKCEPAFSNGKVVSSKNNTESNLHSATQIQLGSTDQKQQPTSPSVGSHAHDIGVPLAISITGSPKIMQETAAAIAAILPPTELPSVLGKHPREDPAEEVSPSAHTPLSCLSSVSDTPPPRTAASPPIITPGSPSPSAPTSGPAQASSTSHTSLLLAHEKALALAAALAALGADGGAAVRLRTYARELRSDLHAPPLDAAGLRDASRFDDGRAALLCATREVVTDGTVEGADREVGRLLRHLRGRLEELESA